VVRAGGASWTWWPVLAAMSCTSMSRPAWQFMAMRSFTWSTSTWSCTSSRTRGRTDASHGYRSVSVSTSNGIVDVRKSIEPPVAVLATDHAMGVPVVIVKRLRCTSHPSS
jgi:hypothetical protein